LLAAENSSLLAARSSTLSEMLTRITIFLTLVSAGLVSLALVGQATGFASPFPAFAVTVLAIVATVGVLTQIRVLAAAHEDLSYVLALNRLRAGYLELDPGLAPYLMTSAHDDRAGSVHTYLLLGRRSEARHVGGSSMVVIGFVTSTVVGLLAAAIVNLAGGATWLMFVAGFAGAIVYFVASLLRGARGYRAVWSTYTPLNPSE
jgi:hypothetical protein